MFIDNYWRYGLSSIVLFFEALRFCFGALVGVISKSTRPITLIDAMDNVRTPQQADVILSSAFTLLKTLGQDNFKKSKDRYTDLEVEKELNTIKQYPPWKDLKKTQCSNLYP